MEETKQSIAFKLAQSPTETIGSGKTYSADVTYAGNILVNTNKFTITASNGNVAVNVNKFIIAGATGNTVIAGKVSLGGLTQYADNAAALVGGLVANDLYIVTASKTIAIVVAA
jgi:hypothetical protein